MSRHAHVNVLSRFCACPGPGLVLGMDVCVCVACQRLQWPVAREHCGADDVDDGSWREKQRDRERGSSSPRTRHRDEEKGEKKGFSRNHTSKQLIILCI